jgi:drug/metabolite transporter (DMT)-like permease
MFDLILTLVCTSANAIIIKLAETRIRDRISMLFVNYVVAGSIAAMFSFGFEHASLGNLGGLSKALGVFGGFIFAFNFFLYFLAIKKRGVAIPSALMRLGAISPLIASVVFFRERPSWLQVAGIVGALGAAMMLSLGIKGGEMTKSGSNESKFHMALWAVGLLLCFSIPDLINKLFQQLGDPEYKSVFLAVIFTCAAIFVGIAAIVKKSQFHREEIIWGILLGIPNLLASYFLVAALTKLPAYIVFPLTASGSVLLVSLVAVTAFKEKMGWLGIAGIGLTIASLVAINVK